MHMQCSPTSAGCTYELQRLSSSGPLRSDGKVGAEARCRWPGDLALTQGQRAPLLSRVYEGATFTDTLLATNKSHAAPLQSCTAGSSAGDDKDKCEVTGRVSSLASHVQRPAPTRRQWPMSRRTERAAKNSAWIWFGRQGPWKGGVCACVKCGNC